MANLGAISSGSTPGAMFDYVTTLPAGPVDGQMCAYGADPTNGVIWWLRYRSGSSSSYKWEYLGGAALKVEVTGQEAPPNSLTYVDFATPMSVTVPLAGDYDIGHGAFIAPMQTASVFISYSVGATAASDTDAVRWMVQDAGTVRDSGSVARFRRKTGIAAGSAIALKGRVADTTATGQTNNRWLEATPVRVG